jgi:hypothetical protein
MMKNNDDKFERFLERARRGRPAEAPEPPFGFATRVAARWAAQGASSDPLLVWERLTRWGLAGALAVCLAVLAVGRDSLRAQSTPNALEALAGLDADEDFY